MQMRAICGGSRRIDLGRIELMKALAGGAADDLIGRMLHWQDSCFWLSTTLFRKPEGGMHVVFTPTLHRTVDSFQSGVRQVCGNYIVRSARGSSNVGQFPFAARTGLLRRNGLELA